MAKVPYSGVPEVSPSKGGVQGFSNSAVPAAFGASVAQAKGEMAQAEGQFGRALAGAGNEIFNRAIALQELANHTAADEADATYMAKAGKLHAEYNALSGKDAVTGYDTYVQNLEKLRKDVGAGLNPAASRLYDRASRSTMSRTVFNGAGHAANEQKRWALGTATAQMELDMRTVADDPNDDVLFQTKLKRVEDNARQLASLRGQEQGGPEEQATVQEAKSKIWSQRILGLARTAPFEASAMLDAHAKEMTEGDRLKVDASVRSNARAVGAANIANSVFGEMRATDERPGKSLEEMEAEVRARAKKFSKDDPILAEHAVNNLYGLWQNKKRIEKTELAENEEIVADAIKKGVRDERELRLDPKVSAAIDALPKAKQLALPGQINRYNAARDKVDNEEVFYKLKGMANNDLGGFVELDFTDPKFKLSARQIDQLDKLKQKIIQQPFNDPRVERALSQIRGSRGAELEALGIYRRTDRNKDDYDRFTGALQQALDVWQDVNKKPASYKDIVETIAPQVLRKQTEPSFFGLWSSEVPMYNKTIPDEWKDSVRKEIVSMGGQPPSEEVLRRAYMREQFQALYGKPKVKGDREAPSAPVSK